MNRFQITSVDGSSGDSRPNNGEVQLNAYNLIRPSATGPTVTHAMTTDAERFTTNDAAAADDALQRKFSIAQLTR